MKVVCMTHKNFTQYPFTPGVPRPAIGEQVTVIGNKKYLGIDCYILDEYKSPFYPMYNYLYDQRNFAPLSNLDETTLVTQEFEEKYFVPVNQ
jgi:hypothetical protein